MRYCGDHFDYLVTFMNYLLTKESILTLDSQKFTSQLCYHLNWLRVDNIQKILLLKEYIKPNGPDVFLLGTLQ